MTRTARLLVTSAGRRVELLNCFRRGAEALGLDLRIAACDLAPGRSAACQTADMAEAVPPCDDPSYADAVLDLAVRFGADLVVPTLDPELPVLAAAGPRFAAAGIRLHCSPPSVIDVVRDKARTAEVLAAAGAPSPRTWRLEEVRSHPCPQLAMPWPLLMKPAGGSASRGIALVERPEALPTTVPEPMILQERLSAPEHTVNIFIDARGELRAAVPHRRLSIRAGEVEKGLTERREDLLRIASQVAAALPEARGVLCFQTMTRPGGSAAVIEINGRFGGGYPLADGAGAPFARWLLEEVTGLPSSADPSGWRAGVLMLRYDAAIFTETTP